MIRIDHMSFGFVAADEEFAHRLYADWDRFCHACVEKVVEECLSLYDKERVLHEIALIDLDLGNIPEEDFYREFPRRLRNELQKALPLLRIFTESLDDNSGNSRLENLLFYLEHGYPKAEWADECFDLSAELEWIATQPAACIRNISKLCLSKEYALHRLLWQAEGEAVFLRLYTAALSEPAASLFEKRRFLLLFLETKPQIPVRFIHEADGDAGLQQMAELLDSVSVRRIMETATGEHAEVDLPPYWHYLYEWLIRYYPYNGLAIFGSKSDFIRYLHRRLLTFIYKKKYSFYFSKEDLTVGFLLEVFGPAYYIEVLNAIYDLQPHHSDGSPVHDNYFDRELYRIFLSLSLIRLPCVSVSFPTDINQASATDTPEARAVGEEENLPQIEEQPKVPDYLFITNAGLCLLTPWFSRLFLMLGYLNEEGKAFKDITSQIRAVFLLQYLTCLEEKAYRETELVFNRVLVDLPLYIPLPKQLELTDEEKQTAESLLEGMKAYWTEMSGTSLKGFLLSFIVRDGKLEQQDEKWILTVDDRAYDILIASVRWGFRLIHFPWLTKHIQVIWHEKQEF